MGGGGGGGGGEEEHSLQILGRKGWGGGATS